MSRNGMKYYWLENWVLKIKRKHFQNFLFLCFELNGFSFKEDAYKQEGGKEDFVVWLCLVLPVFVYVSFHWRDSSVWECGDVTNWKVVSKFQKKGPDPDNLRGANLDGK